ncbi:zn 2cys6 transcription factor [Ophiostoma piceae UAMH 11346]|uniref:Zn 2cys6 transcription factor n=1 Tax=Ophiostoma piceae (strain UAMH 11346) TaxID=1262450 RepID=S3CT17_OPHP1|nr:zn 2cys6 transcription factor [Ophiostoma piceae UAMH 11346]
MSTAATGNSRKGKKLPTAACDLCRLRKIQCNFTNEDDRSCKRCLSAGVDCTFLRGHRPRGRVSRYVTAAQEQKQGQRPRDLSVASDASTPHTNGGSPDTVVSDGLVPNIGVTHLCPLSCMALILTDFQDYLYPVLPFVHLPTLMTAVNKQLSIHEPHSRRLFQTVMAVAAATVASIPRRFSSYSNGQYASVQAMVDRATRLVYLSRGMSDTPMDDDTSLESCATSMILALAAYYTGRSTVSRSLNNESIVFFRSLRLYRKHEHEMLSGFESEICKRLFWLLYISQIHDRLDSVVPHFPFCFDPPETDWEFLMPRESEDEVHFYANSPPDLSLTGADGTNGSSPSLANQPLGPNRPIVSGFCALLRVYLCVVDVFSADFPRPPASVLLAMSLSTEPRSAAMSSMSAPERYAAPVTAQAMSPGMFRGTQLTLESVTRLVQRLDTTLAQLPAELQVAPEQYSRSDAMQTLPRNMMQRLVVAANIRMTILFVQSTTLEMFAAQTETQRAAAATAAVGPPSTNGHDEGDVEAKIWELRELFASQTLDILRQFPPEALEANGSSLIIKARKIAATLLERDETHCHLSADAIARMDGYLEQFVHALAGLDYVYPNLKALNLAAAAPDAGLL